MIITSFEYEEKGWTLEPVNFRNLNLIVGRNAVGKSRTLNAMVQVARFILGNPKNNMTSHSCRLTFGNENGRKELDYSYSCEGLKITKESLVDNDGKTIVSRENDNSFIFEERVSPPNNKLIIQSQRDTEKYPIFEEIIEWAEHTRGVALSSLSATNVFKISDMFETESDIDYLLENVDDDSKEFVKKKMRDLGYAIDAIQLITLSEKFKLPVVLEQNVQVALLTGTMSNGMLRVLYIMIYLVYVASKDVAKTLLIDDLGEGLDFERSAKLSEFLFDYCKRHGIQLIVSSNDNFLMNVVHLSHWIILRRSGDTVCSISEITHPKLFKKFKFTGLSNFDLYRTDFVDKYLAQESK